MSGYFWCFDWLRMQLIDLLASATMRDQCRSRSRHIIFCLDQYSPLSRQEQVHLYTIPFRTKGDGDRREGEDSTVRRQEKRTDDETRPLMMNDDHCNAGNATFCTARGLRTAMQSARALSYSLHRCNRRRVVETKVPPSAVARPLDYSLPAVVRL